MQVRKPLRDFMDFIREQGVVALAIGLTVGVAVTAFVNSIVTNIINPIVGVVLPGRSDLEEKYICLDTVAGVCTNKLAWGAVLSSFIAFVTIAAVVYFGVKVFKLDRIDKKKT
jgi:large conductance mechanosensitive channel